MMASFWINGQLYQHLIEPGQSLLSLLRALGWVGSRQGCSTGDCGACTVLINHQPVQSCLYPAHRCQDQPIITIEGLSQHGQLDPVQQAFLNGQGFQCGFCTPGMILSTRDLLQQGVENELELRRSLSGNLCRCTGYQAIIESLGTEPPLSHYKTTEPVGQNIPKQDGPTLVTGQPAYTQDFSMTGLLYLKVIRSPHAHALIKAIHTKAALALDGVHAVLTPDMAPRQAYTTAGHADPEPDPLDHYLLDYKVRYCGDRVAAVVAESETIAIKACGLIEVEYEILPHVLDPTEAMTGAVVIHDETESSQIADPQHNIAAQVVFEEGDLEQGFASADYVIEQCYQVPAVQHCHLEPHSSTAWLDDQGVLTLRSSTQVPFHCQRLLAKIFNRPIETIRVIKGKIGGGFGNKQEILTEDLCAWATLVTGRPVQWVLTRHEEFTATNSRHAMQIRLKTGIKANGTLVAQDMEVIANTGAYGNHGPTVTFLTGYASLGLYRCPHKRFKGYCVYTNTMPAGAFRGYGVTQGAFALESQMDEAAIQLGLDPIELRCQNLIRPGDSLQLGQTEDHFNLIGSYALDQCLDQVVQALKPTSSKQNGCLKRGIGFAVSMQGSGLSKIHAAGVELSLTPQGSVILKTGSVDVGTGSDTSLRQIAAQLLGIAVGDIELIAADTQLTPFDAGSYASATMYITGQSVKQAAELLQDQIRSQAATVLQCQPQDIILESRKLRSPHSEMTLSDLAQTLEHPLVATTMYTADESSLTFAVQGVEVEVDIETGKVRILNCVQAIDLGQAINPRMCEGQATGGIVMGIGYALTESLVFDQHGRILNPSFRTYRIPTAAEIPSMQIILIEEADPYGPFGAKGVGEITTNCTAPAIANAIYDAIGIRMTRLPMTPEAIWTAIQASQSIDH